MSVLRIRCSLTTLPPMCEWGLADGHVVRGAGTLAEAPKHASRVELVVPASDVTIARAHLPPRARRRAGSVLAYAIEDETLGDPDAQHACWLGVAGPADMVAVVDREALAHTLAALERAGLEADDVYSETLLLPRHEGEWSIFWDGREGFVRTGALEGAATDEGDARTPPLALHLMLKDATGTAPVALAVYVASPDAMPDLDAWYAALGIPVRYEDVWDWRSAAAKKDARLAFPRRSRRAAELAARLKPAAWLVAAALLVHAGALAIEWGALSAEQRTLRERMEARFRAVFPDAVAVADPALQMRRRLADARHAAGIVDPDDFLPALARAAPAVMSLAAGSLRAVSYENGNLTVHLSGVDEAALRAVMARLADAGVTVVRRTRTSADGAIALTLGGA